MGKHGRRWGRRVANEVSQLFQHKTEGRRRRGTKQRRQCGLGCWAWVVGLRSGFFGCGGCVCGVSDDVLDHNRNGSEGKERVEEGEGSKGCEGHARTPGMGRRNLSRGARTHPDEADLKKNGGEGV